MTRSTATALLVLFLLSGPTWAQQRGGGGGPGPRDHDPSEGVERNSAPVQVSAPFQIVALLAEREPSAAQQLAQRLAQQLALRVTALYQLFSMEATLAVFDNLSRQPPGTVVLLLSRESGVIAADLNDSLEVLRVPMSQLQYAPQLLEVERVHATLHGRNILVAIVDTGIDTAHEDLRGVVAAHENLVEGDTQLRAGTHGTAEAGIIAARLGNDAGMVGMAPEARIVALRACVPVAPSAAAATCLAHRVARGVDAAVRHGAQIVNLSLGEPTPNRVVTKLVLQAMIVHGLAVVAAAGNNGPSAPPLYPAALPGVIAAGATDNRNLPYEKSNLGRHVAILAPGVDILAPLPGNRHAFVTGTSFAAAHVSGALALLMEARRDLGVPDLIAALKNGARPVGSLNVGRVDVCRSLALMGRPDVCR